MQKDLPRAWRIDIGNGGWIWAVVTEEVDLQYVVRARLCPAVDRAAT